MPGLLQYLNDMATNNPSTHELSHPEKATVWLPSHLPFDIRHRICIVKLPEIEDKLRTAHCFDALQTLRHTLRVKSRLVKFKNQNVRGQREGLRSRAIIDRVHEKARAAAERYRASRAAKLRLSGPGPWERELQPLADADIRGYQDPNRLHRRKGRRGTLEDDQLELQEMELDGPAETDSFTLLKDIRTRRDGTGESRRALSWIWLAASSTDDSDSAADCILQVEWAKSRARAARAKEEVLLLREEMRQVLEFLEWKAMWWTARENQRSKTGSKDLLEGLSAYAKVQSELQRTLAAHFRAIWQQPLCKAESLLGQPHASAATQMPDGNHSPVPHTQSMDLSGDKGVEEEDSCDEGDAEEEDSDDLEADLEGGGGYESDAEGVLFYC